MTEILKLIKFRIKLPVQREILGRFLINTSVRFRANAHATLC